MPTTNPRAWVTLTPEEADEVEWQARARGMRPSELLREALRAYLRQPSLDEAAAAAVPPGADDQAATAAALDRAAAAAPAVLTGPALPPRGDQLAPLAATLERAAATLAGLLPAAEALRAERAETRAVLDDIAEAVGAIAGALAPGAAAAADDVAEDAFGLSDGR